VVKRSEAAAMYFPIIQKVFRWLESIIF